MRTFILEYTKRKNKEINLEKRMEKVNLELLMELQEIRNYI